jgi:DNA-binding GntR family transcriptional regulator
VSVAKLLRKATASQLVTTTILAEALRKGWFVLEPKRLENASATFRSVTVDIRRRRCC